MSTRKQKRQDEVRQTPVAEAIAIGTAAGGLVLGTIEAQGAEHKAQNPAADLAQATIGNDHALTGHQAHVAGGSEVGPDQAVPDAPAQASAEPVPVPVEPEAIPVHGETVPAAPAPVAAEPVDASSIPNTIPAPMESQLVAELSEQMTATLVKVIGSVEPGQSPAEIGQSIAGDIISSAQQIVANLDIGSLLAQTQNLDSDIIGQIDVPDIAAEVLGATSGIANTVLTEVADLPSAILDNTVAELIDLPSSLLGNEGPEGSGGMLSELFYADGGSDSLAIPDLGAMVDSLATDTSGIVGLLGLNYVDAQDHAGGHGLNAFSLL